MAISQRQECLQVQISLPKSKEYGNHIRPKTLHLQRFRYEVPDNLICSFYFWIDRRELHIDL
uniref:Uncharacterized protein n=1 Tax=Arundo donax TaxID=35708 RepID=A0A0A9EB27_ARUDO